MDLHSGVTQFPVVSGPHLPAVPLALATAFVPLCLSFPSKLVNPWQVFRSRPDVRTYVRVFVSYYLVHGQER